MHDPDAVLFGLHLPLPRVKWEVVGSQKRWEIRRRRYTGERLRGQPIRQWWRPDAYSCHLAGRVLGLVPLARVWHREPGGRDSGDVCGRFPDGTNLTWRNVTWGWRHRAHLWVQWTFPGTGLWRWWSTRCDACSRRFGHKEARIGEWSGDRVWHEACYAIEGES